MSALPPDVWAMMIFSVLVFFGVSICALVFTLRQEEQKMEILRAEDELDTHSPRALADLRAWIEAHPTDADVEGARATYRDCVDALRSTERHFYDWSVEDIDRLEPL
jgi:hypothetical protein